MPTTKSMRQAVKPPQAEERPSLERPVTMDQQRRRDVADGRQRLEQAERVRPGRRRHDLGDEGDADGELAADAQAR